ncbi:formate dehydrogenase accessory sulfurtransferase FdhD [Methanoregula sp.]|uniref:formate dehydrogenase accessory sulfurtransferase FdhD n=1 Tax=Methanoregula sp. TaxID=2052170 RepID=UPI002631AEBB|nr:formate dehydrogenase accessory sulfurtransferase FdhD [Methanoregula sp.]MDD5143417.1 formate dehydrogenase accessory sulfurtransferase FdhD [Methanoregula sp.]
MIHIHHAIQVTGGVPRETDDAIVIEDRFELLLNDRPVATMVASRDQLRELGAGYVISEGLVRCVDTVILDGDRILVCSGTGCEMNGKKQETGSSGGQSFLSPSKKVAGSPDLRITPEEVIAVTREIETELWRKTGGVHCSVLFSGGRLLAKSSDVGRHNTVDKLVGHAALNGIDLSRCVIGCTGRQPAGMVRKSANAGIPIIISRAASTDKGIAEAEAAGITLIGFSRGDRFTIYTHPSRVVLPENGTTGL